MGQAKNKDILTSEPIAKGSKMATAKDKRQDSKNGLEQKKIHPLAIAATVMLAIASLYLFTLPTDIARPFFDKLPFNLLRIVIIVATISALIYTTRSQLNSINAVTDIRQHKRLFYSVLCIAILLVVVQLIFPEFATLLVRKESWPFFRNAIFIKCAFEIVGVVAFFMIAQHYYKAKRWLACVVAILFMLLLFIMAGEELSWGQRIFQWSTPDAFGSNEQRETNLHNLATQAFQNTLYFGTWLLLIALPFWRDSIKRLIINYKQLRPFRFIVDWMPPSYFVLVFAVAFGFSDPLKSETGPYFSSNLFIILGTLTILVYLLVQQVRARQSHWQLTAISLIAFLVVLASNLFLSKVWDYNPGAATEYLELFIIFGVMLWSIGVYRNTIKSSKPSVHRIKNQN